MDSQKINIKVNGVAYSVSPNQTILQAAKEVGIDIPTLCYLKDINEIGACRLCVVEVKGQRNLVASCVFPVNADMEIVTNSTRVFNSRKHNLELILSNHNKSCLACVRSGDCELQNLSRDYGIKDLTAFSGAMSRSTVDTSAAPIVRDNSKCVLCRRCVAVCDSLQGVSVIGANERGFDTHISCAFERDLNDVACVGCGQCVVACPTGALYEQDSTAEVWAALNNPNKHVIVQTAPAVRAALGEEFGLPIGTNVEGKMVAALRRMGFAKVFDTDFAADVTIMEEGTEFIHRVKNGGVLPLITSCSPGWIKYCEHNYPELIANLSTCKSPQQMFGALTKTWYAEKFGIDPANIFVVSAMPCTAKKFEIGREDQNASGFADVDASITTREVATMIRKIGIDFANLADEKFDDLMGESTGAAVIFGATGGVMEAALRTCVEVITGKTAPSVDFKEVRGTEGIKEATYEVGGLTVNVAVASGLANAKKVLDEVKANPNKYQFIEIMACPGGCVNGGGQPHQPGSIRNFVDIRGKRASALYSQDAAMAIRKSHENPVVQQLYKEYLGEPGSHKAHDILHTTYVARNKY